jgi:hypothetical protein
METVLIYFVRIVDKTAYKLFLEQLVIFSE